MGIDVTWFLVTINVISYFFPIISIFLDSLHHSQLFDCSPIRFEQGYFQTANDLILLWILQQIGKTCWTIVFAFCCDFGEKSDVTIACITVNFYLWTDVKGLYMIEVYFFYCLFNVFDLDFFLKAVLANNNFPTLNKLYIK